MPHTQPTKFVKDNAKVMKFTHNSPAKLTPQKAGKMLKEGMARGHKLSKAQRGLFGVIASGRKPRKGY